MHDYFYHLHLPRTGGTHFRHNMMPSLIPYFKNNKVNIHEISETDTAHWCWFEPIINESTYIFSSFRDPAERLVSQFVRQAQKAISQGQTSYSKYDINKINFYKWIEKNPEMYKNIQAKSLVYYNKDHSIYKPSTGVKWEFDKTPIRDHYMFDKDFVNFQINKNDLMKNFNRINLKIDASSLKDENKQLKILNKILNDFKIKSLIQINEPQENFFTGITDKIFESLSNKEKKKLYLYQDLDSELFFSDSFFIR